MTSKACTAGVFQVTFIFSKPSRTLKQRRLQPFHSYVQRNVPPIEALSVLATDGLVMRSQHMAWHCSRITCVYCSVPRGASVFPETWRVSWLQLRWVLIRTVGGGEETLKTERTVCYCKRQLHWAMWPISWYASSASKQVFMNDILAWKGFCRELGCLCLSASLYEITIIIFRSAEWNLVVSMRKITWCSVETCCLTHICFPGMCFRETRTTRRRWPDVMAIWKKDVRIG